MKTHEGRLIVGSVLCVLVLSSCGLVSKGSSYIAKGCRAERRNVEIALSAYKADNGVYPDSLTTLAGIYLKSDPSANWTYEAQSAGVSGISPTGTYKAVSFADCGSR